MNYFVFILLVVGALAIDPPIWPDHFSQSMTVNFGDLVTTGKFWYDATFDASKYDFQNGNTRSGCGALLPIQTPCSYLTVNKKMFMYFPERQLCCKVAQNTDIMSRNWMKNFTFKGQQEIDDEKFYVWDMQNDQGNYDVRILTDQSPRRVPKREYTGRRIFFDYWTKSYSEQKIDPLVFREPTHCEKFCYDHISNEQDLIQFEKGIEQFLMRSSKLQQVSE